ncbi:hypothetical protein [Dactylococcopsis salina]|uniref:hypothetical protein n=1 Tax=Dactylococcopsis salina TaxID=292566 RepID=UPI0002D5F727|nr:hypothetical protein [Dactylococcopsis salina]
MVSLQDFLKSLCSIEACQYGEGGYGERIYLLSGTFSKISNNSHYLETLYQETRSSATQHQSVTS